MVRPTSYVPESKRLNVLLHEFKAKQNHMAIVIDEFGGIAGLVTIEDVLEQIVGDIKDEYDPADDVHAKIRPLVDGRSEEHTSELQSRPHLVCRLLLEKKNK